MPCYEFEGKRPSWGTGTFVHPDAVLIGEVVLGDRCYVGAGAILRADCGKILIGSGSNIQEGCVLHSEPGSNVEIAENVLVGHRALIHGPCKIESYASVGMGAIVNTMCLLKQRSFLAVGSVLPPGAILEEQILGMGVPARPVRAVGEQLSGYLQQATLFYQDMAGRCLHGLKELPDPEKLIDIERCF
ncbi:MAG: gamma carbonic anhydrase family protein [Solirubrobacterales bacterium]